MVRCLTCKERKVKCDGAQPECNKCRIAGRICRAGHAFALSWPKPRSRRALEGPRSAQDQGHAAAAARQAGSGAQRYFFVNADADHIAAHYLLPYVGSSRGTRAILFERNYTIEASVLVPPRMVAPSLYADVGSSPSGSFNSLMSHFYYEASTSLPQLDCEPDAFRDLLLRMSAQDGSPSSKAVLYAIFSLSALRRYGNVQESTHFKDLALQALRQAANGADGRVGLAAPRALQHMAACLVLCRAEICLGDESSIFWVKYICSLRYISRYAFPDMFNGRDRLDGDSATLYRYLHYHDTLARFSISHWQRPSHIEDQFVMKFHGVAVELHCHGEPQNFVHSRLSNFLEAEMQLLSRVLEVTQKLQTDPDYVASREYHQILQSLEAEVDEALHQTQDDCRDLARVDVADHQAVADARLSVQRYFFVAAMWIYFQRTCRHLTGQSAAIDALVDDVFSLSADIQRLNVRIIRFSLFLIGAEANTESRRYAVLDFLHHQPKLLPVATGDFLPCKGNVNPAEVGGLVSKAWVQDDLHNNTEGYLDYLAKMHYVITARPVVPALV